MQSKSLSTLCSTLQNFPLLLDGGAFTVPAWKALTFLLPSTLSGKRLPFNGQFSQKGVSADWALNLQLLCPGTELRARAGPVSNLRKLLSLPVSPLLYSARQSFFTGSFKWLWWGSYSRVLNSFRNAGKPSITPSWWEDCPARSNTQKTFPWWCG